MSESYQSRSGPPLVTGESAALREAWTLGSTRLRNAILAARGQMIGVDKTDKLIWNTTPGYATALKAVPVYPSAVRSLAEKQAALAKAAQSAPRDPCFKCGCRGDVPCGCAV
jgi:hypothetical protein